MSDPIAAALTHAIGMRVHEKPRSVTGGSNHAALMYRTQRAPVFVKVAPLASAAMFAAEAAGLRELASAKAIRVPEVFAIGKVEDSVFLCLEWLELISPNRIAHTRMGEQLATLHATTADRYGWIRDNFIGATPQSNAEREDWVDFFREQRLRPQLDLAATEGADAHTIDRGRRLCESIQALFDSYRPSASLVHGDLWGGNWGALGVGEPVIFDPAVYYGDRETDIAMTRLFGGFDAAFYDAYEAVWPLDPGAATRATLYNLYHVLNHFNLFGGGGYLAQARSIIDQLLAMTGP
jgi:protein-ribulosamine 3-kinase